MAWIISVKMAIWKEVGPWLLLTNYISAVTCTVCKEICNEIWTNGSPDNDTIFSNYRRNKPDDATYVLNWQWKDDLVGKWSLYYKEWPRRGIQSGGYLLAMKRKKALAKLDWKVYNGAIVWTSFHRQPFEFSWNATICSLNLPIKFESTMRGWRFYLGNILLNGNKSGILQLNGTTLLSSAEEADLMAVNRKKRETEELSDEQKKTVWNKIKGYFREFFDQGDDDQRGWLKRLGDWVLGFLERVLS